MSELKLKGQTALITGGDSGIGKGIALKMAANGANILVNYHSNKKAAEETVEELKAFDVSAITYQANVGDEMQVQQMFQEAINRFGTIDILVNNAGLQQDSAFKDMTLDQWNKVININLTGQFLCAREAVREFIKRGPRPEVSKALGKIICISSVHEVIPWGGHANYAASKGGIMMLMKSMAQELGGLKIRINSIGPGAIKTPINHQAWETPAAAQNLLKLIPYDRIGETEDIGNAAVWLASDESDYVHGITLFVDGGMTLYPGFASNG
ncbi:SDR family oxidoreductase [Cytophaga aurantiaca]|uniref:SDR family oxidoreductase n=1 Tax=Cytophaga aurantiaca TaxID=29530 RepID=UPI00036E7884|nr:SDR family oxidoreductase [Cytophaga aurantiaca]